MNLEQIRDYCLQKKGVTEDTPFGPEILVFRVGQKIFLLTSLYNPELSINLKCDPDRAIELRAQYNQIIPGYHMNKKHWNTVSPQLLPATLIKSLIDHSYELIFNALPSKARLEIQSNKEN